MRWTSLAALLACASVVFGNDIIVLDEDFEAGLGDWTTHVFTDPGEDNENTPEVFNSAGQNVGDGDDMYGTKLNSPGSQTVGFSTFQTGGWDGINPQWLQRQFTAAVPPGTYNVTITSDRYMWWCRTDLGMNCQDPNPTWQAANQILVLTDNLFDDGEDHLEDGLGTSGMRRTMWARTSENGAWDTRTHLGYWLLGYTDTAQITTTTGDIEIRLQLWEKDDGELTAAWDNLTIHLEDASDPGNTWTFTDDFEGADPLADWEYKLPGTFGQIPEFRTFTPTDLALYDNINNPGSTTAGYSNAYEQIAGFNWFWAQQQFPGVADPGVTYTARLEFDRYVFWERYPLVYEPVVFPDAGSMYGDNVGHNGTPCVGYYNNQPNALNYDDPDSAWVWMHQLIPAAESGLEPGVTYDLNVQARIYVEDHPSIGDWNVAGGVALATDDSYSSPNSLGSWRKTLWANQGGDSGQGSWLTHNQDYLGVDGFQSSSGDLDIVLFWQEKSGAILDRIIAFDDIVLTFTDQNTQQVVYTFTADFDGPDPLADWEATYRNSVPQPWAVGNMLHVLTDDKYGDPDIEPESNAFAVYWDGYPDVLNNGVWVHEVVELPLVSSTGDIEVRLTYRMKEPRKQVVAWDNVTLTLVPPDPVCPNPDLRFDWDNDGDVDQDDFAYFQRCFTGTGDPMGVFDFDACRCMNTDGDSDIDTADFNAFAACAATSGPDIPADITCDDGLFNP